MAIRTKLFKPKLVMLLAVLLLWLQLNYMSLILLCLAGPILNTRSSLLRACNYSSPLFSRFRHPSSTMIFLLLISGDVELNPGPTENQQAASPAVPASANSGMCIYVHYDIIKHCHDYDCRYGMKLVPGTGIC